MDSITAIATAASGLPWWAALIVVLATIAVTKGIDGAVKWLSFKFEIRKYGDGKKREAQTALEAELRKQLDELKADFKTVLADMKVLRDDHMQCKIETEKLRGEVRVLTEKVSRLEGHDQANKEHVKGLREAVKKIDPTAAAEIP